ncbi:unnamed protein product [Symbiodinium sp. CCMP2592]|nr:unnamed protein product [Symbiodinium sp. CCMP2592]
MDSFLHRTHDQVSMWAMDVPALLVAVQSGPSVWLSLALIILAGMMHLRRRVPSAPTDVAGPVNAAPTVLQSPLAEQMHAVLPALLHQELPPILQQVLPSLLQTAMQALPHPAQGAPDSTTTDSINLAISTVRSVMDEALEAKGGMLPSTVMGDVTKSVDSLLVGVEKLLASRYTDFEEILQKQANGLLRQVQDKHKDTQAALDANKQLLQNLAQSAVQANKTEQARFQTLDTNLKTAVDVLETNVKARLDLLNSDLATKFGNWDTSQARLEVLVAKLEGIITKMDGIPAKIGTYTDRVEHAVRERIAGVQQDVNKVQGEVGQMGRDQMGLTRRLNASLDSLQATVANMGAAVGATPTDSNGTRELLDLTKELAAQTGATSEAVAELSELVKELHDKPTTTQPQQPRSAGPSSSVDMGPQPMPTTPGAMPAVIDLSSRIPQRGSTQSPVWATVVLSNGRRLLVPEDDVLGAQQQQGPTFMHMR